MYTYEDGGVLHGTYVDGDLNGPAQEFDGEGRLVFKGQYKDNNRCGECWVYYPVSQLSVHYSTVEMFTCMENLLGVLCPWKYLSDLFKFSVALNVLLKVWCVASAHTKHRS